MRYNGITIMPVRSLETGDLIAKEFLGHVVSGKISALVFSGYQLTDEQREYMASKKLTIPENEYEPLGGHTSYLVFGDFVDSSSARKSGHMYLDFDVNVAVFETKEREKDAPSAF